MSTSTTTTTGAGYGPPAGTSGHGTPDAKESPPRRSSFTRTRRALGSSGWALPALKVAGSLLALYVCLFVLQALVIATNPEPDRVRLDPLPRVWAGGILPVSGRAPVGSSVDVLVSNGITLHAIADEDGRFNVPVDGKGSAAIVVRVTEPPSAQPVYIAEDFVRPVVADLPPKLRSAVRLKESGEIWVSGTTSPFAPIEVSTSSDARGVRIEADEFGLFDAVVGDSARAARFAVVRPIDRRPDVYVEPSASFSFMARAEDTLPAWASRSLLLADSLAVQSDTGTLLARDSRFDVDASKHSFSVTVTLPSSHAYVEALARGIMRPADFLLRTIGTFEGLSGRDPVRAQAIVTRAGRTTVTLAGDLATDSLIYLGWVASGIAARPLLTSNDSVSVHAPNGRVVTLQGPAPARNASDTVTWSGPLSSAHSLALRVESSSLVTAARDTTSAGATEPRGETLHQVLQSAETRIEQRAVTRTLGTIVVLLPFGLIVWLARRRPIGPPAAWAYVAGMTLVFGVWRCWNYLFSIGVSTSDVVDRMVTPVRANLGIGEPTAGNIAASAREAATLVLVRRDSYGSAFSGSDASANVFLLLFICAVASAPLYLPTAIRIATGTRKASPPAQRSLLEGFRRVVFWIWTSARLVVAAVLATMLAQLTPTLGEIRGASSAGLGQSVLWIRLLDKWTGLQLGDNVVLAQPRGVALVASVLAAALLLVFGLRAGLFGIGLVLLAFYSVMQGDPSHFLGVRVEAPETSLTVIGTILKGFSALPLWLVLMIVGATAYPLVLQLSRGFAPPEQRRRGLRWSLAMVLLVLTLFVPRLPPTPLLLVGAFLILFGMSWVVGRTLLAIHRGDVGRYEVLRRVRHQPRQMAVALAVLTLVVAFPIGGTGRPLRFVKLLDFIGQSEALYIYLVAAMVALLLVRAGSTALPDDHPAWRTAAIVFFAVFLVNSSLTWLFIPVPLLVGLVIARYWLFRDHAEMRQLLAGVADQGDRKQLVRQLLDDSRAQRHVEAVEKELTAQFHKATLTPDDYATKVANLREHFKDALSSDEVVPGVTKRRALLAIGKANRAERVRTTLKYAALLAVVPSVVAIYQYSRNELGDDAYPLAGFWVFLISVLASWLLYAFYLGYYFHELRGKSGLTKGILLFVALTVPAAAVHLLGAQGLNDMASFLVWAMLLFAFCSLLGLLLDYSVLRESGARFRDLTLVHNVPVLSAYGSSLVAATIPIVTGLFKDGLADVVKTLSKVVFRGTSP